MCRNVRDCGIREFLQKCALAVSANGHPKLTRVVFWGKLLMAEEKKCALTTLFSCSRNLLCPWLADYGAALILLVLETKNKSTKNLT